MRSLISLLSIALCLGAGSALAGARLHLIDGQVLDGTALERKDGLYVLELETGDRLTIPVDLVAKVQLTGDDDPDATGFVEAEGKTLIGPEGGVHLPDTAEQLEAIGRPPSVFVKGVFDPVWKPSTDWDLDPEAGNNWNPSRWATSPIDWNWTPRSVFRQSTDVTEFSPTRWIDPPISPFWEPSTGN